MASAKFGNSVAIAMCLASFAVAQNQSETCYETGSIVGAVVGTLVVTLGLLVSSFFLYKMYWKNRKGKHLVLVMNDSENPLDQYAFDNPCFREASPIKHNLRDERQSSKPEKAKWAGWPSIHPFGKEQKSEKITSMDDSYINDSRLKFVTLRSHDFTGLGFNICGNMRDGIFVKDVLHRGPAFESGCINAGDRIHSVCISFRNMVFEDALTILSYASPYDVQVQVENDLSSRPSTLMRSKRGSNAINSSDKILHPIFNRSQSISHLNEIEKSGNKKVAHQIGFMLEKNRLNHSLKKSQNFSDFLIPKCSSPVNDGRTGKNFAPKISALLENKKSPKSHNHDRECDFQQTRSMDSQNKLQKFGIKVLPVNMNPRMGIQSMSGGKKLAKSLTAVENQLNSAEEKPEDDKQGPDISSMDEKASRGLDESDSNIENVKAMLAKGFFTLKDKINQNTLGKKKKDEGESVAEEDVGKSELEETKKEHEEDCPVPKLRSSVACGVKAYEQNQQNHMLVPEEVSRAGDIARNNRKSIVETKKSLKNSEYEDRQVSEIHQASDSDDYSDKESVKDETKKTKRNKGKAPAPPKQIIISKKINEIIKDSEPMKDAGNIFEPEYKTIPLKDENEAQKNPRSSYDSDSDSEPTAAPKVISTTKIELKATQVTVHQNPTVDINEEDDVEPSRKAASLGDLSKLDSEQPLSIVLERAVSLDLTEGTSQCGKKRKAPPPPEEFSGVFDDLNYRKESRLEDLSTFQRKLKKSSDFGTLEDALCDGPRETEVNKPSSLDMTETHSYNIQEFSSWLAECRRPKATEEENQIAENKTKVSSTSLINIHASDPVDKEKETEEEQEFRLGNVSFSVNGKNFPNFDKNAPRTNSRTVLVISQPNSLEPIPLEAPKESNNEKGEPHERLEVFEDVTTPPKLPTSPMPTSNTVSSPLSSTLTYITEIKVSTAEQESKRSEFGPSPLNSNGEQIQKFDSPKAFESSLAKNHFNELSKIPIRTMKSETGQKILATIQSLAKESYPTKTPEVEYAKKMAFILSNSQKNEINIKKNEAIENEALRPNMSGLYLPPPIPKPSKDYSLPRKVPPVVPPRKAETPLTTKSTVTVELTTRPCESPDKNIVTFSSFHNEGSGTSSWTSFKINERGDINGREENAGDSENKSTRKVMFESEESKGEF